MRPTCILILAFVLQGPLASAQTTTPGAVVPAGGNGTNGGHSLGWSLGQPSSSTFVAQQQVLTTGVQQPEGVQLALNVAMLLDGPFDAVTGLMHDSLRTRGFIPTNEPFTALGHPPVGLQHGGTLQPAALLVAGPDAIVDWVFIELRGADDASRIDAARAALLQRDGDVVDMDGSAAVAITALPGNYRIAVRHRNHLPVLSQQPVALAPGGNSFSLVNGAVPLHVPDAQVVRGAHHLLWCGDVNADAQLKYTGPGNDRDPILVRIGGTVPTNVASGYLPEDVNLDGTVKYTGIRNDRDPILQNIGGTVPTNVRSQPLP